MIENIFFNFNSKIKPPLGEARLVLKEPHKKPRLLGVIKHVLSDELYTFHRVVNSGANLPTTVTWNPIQFPQTVLRTSLKLSYAKSSATLSVLRPNSEWQRLIVINTELLTERAHDTFVTILRKGSSLNGIDFKIDGEWKTFFAKAVPQPKVEPAVKTRLDLLEADNKKWENFFSIQKERKEWREWKKSLGPSEDDDAWD